MHPRHWLAFAALASIWGTTWRTIKIVVRESQLVSAAGARFALAALLLAAFALWQGRSLAWSRWRPAEHRLLLALSLLMFAVPYGLVLYGELTVSSALAAILFSSHSAFTLVFDSVRVGRNLFDRARVAGLAPAFAGLLVIFWPKLTGPRAELAGIVALVVAAASSALAAVLAKHGAHGIDPVAGTTWQMAGAAVWLLAAGGALERPALTGYSATALVALLYLAVFGSCVTFVLYYGLLKHLAPVQLSTLSFVIPVIATFAGWLVLDERLAPQAWGRWWRASRCGTGGSRSCSRGGTDARPLSARAHRVGRGRGLLWVVARDGRQHPAGADVDSLDGRLPPHPGGHRYGAGVRHRLVLFGGWRLRAAGLGGRPLGDAARARHGGGRHHRGAGGDAAFGHGGRSR